MAFNPSPKVAAARDVAKKFNKDEVIIIMVDNGTQTVEYASYGKNEFLCARAREKADVAFNAIVRESK